MKVKRTFDNIYYKFGTDGIFLSAPEYNAWSRIAPFVQHTYLFAGYRLWL